MATEPNLQEVLLLVVDLGYLERMELELELEQERLLSVLALEGQEEEGQNLEEVQRLAEPEVAEDYS